MLVLLLAMHLGYSPTSKKKKFSFEDFFINPFVSDEKVIILSETCSFYL